MHTESYFRTLFEREYKLVLEYCGIGPEDGKYIHNIDEKGARISLLSGQEVVVPIGIKEMYVGIPENRISLTIIESISADRKVIPPVVICPSKQIMASWFSNNMTGHELIIVSETGYTNKSICLIWLDHFIKHNKYGLDKH
jgi:hypothetical protein